MKTTYSFALLVISTIVLSACGAANGTQGAGANSDGTCNDDLKNSAYALVSTLGTANRNIQADQASGVANYGDIINQTRTAKQACDAFVGKFGTTVCNVNDENGNTHRVDTKQVVQACSSVSSFNTDCDGNYVNAFMDFAKSAQELGNYVNSDGTLSSAATYDSAGFASAARDVNNKCPAFENAYAASYSCSLTISGKTTALSSAPVHTLCDAIKTKLANPSGSTSFDSLSEIETGGAVKTARALIHYQTAVSKLGI